MRVHIMHTLNQPHRWPLRLHTDRWALTHALAVSFNVICRRESENLLPWNERPHDTDIHVVTLQLERAVRWSNRRQIGRLQGCCLHSPSSCRSCRGYIADRQYSAVVRLYTRALLWTWGESGLFVRSAKHLEPYSTQWRRTCRSYTRSCAIVAYNPDMPHSFWSVKRWKVFNILWAPPLSERKNSPSESLHASCGRSAWPYATAR